MKTYIFIVAALLALFASAKAEEEVVILKGVQMNVDMKVACMKLALRNIPLKEDFFEVEYMLTVNHFSEGNGPLRSNAWGKQIWKLQSGDNLCSAMALYDRKRNEHVTHICGPVNSTITDITGLKGVLKLGKGNYTTDLHLKTNSYIAIDLPRNTPVSSRMMTSNKNLCKEVRCQHCTASCTALYKDSPQVVCNHRLMNAIPREASIAIQAGGVYYPSSRTVCVNLHASPNSEYRLFALVDGSRLESTCRMVTDAAGDGFNCFSSDLSTIQNNPVRIFKVHLKSGTKHFKYNSKIELIFRQMEFERSNRTLAPNTQHVSCSKIVEQDWYVPFKKKIPLP